MQHAWRIPLFLFVSCAALSLSRPAYGPELGFSDHFSHMNASRLFPRLGRGLWQSPLANFFEPVDMKVAATLPKDLRTAGIPLAVPGWKPEKEPVVTWTQLPRPYPPGILLLVGPIGALYHFTSMSFGAAAHSLIILVLGCAHYFFFLALRDTPEHGRRVYLAAVGLAYAYVAFWTLRGFYDMAAAIPLIIGGRAIKAKQWRIAFVAISCAFFLHYRALFYVPWAILAVREIIRAREWQSWRAGEWSSAFVAVTVGCVSLYTFALVAPSLARFPAENPIHPGQLKTAPVVAFALSATTAAVLFIRSRAMLDLAMLAWIALILVGVRQVQAWHVFLLIPWVLTKSTPPILPRLGRIAFVTCVTVAVIL
jgi:hypothetical protein